MRSTTRLIGSAGEVAISGEMPAVLIGVGSGGAAVTPDMDVAPECRDAVEQARAGAAVVEVRVARAGQNEASVLPELVAAIGQAVGVPLFIRATDPEALDAALAVCPGKPLVSLCDQPASLQSRFLAVAQRHGAAVIMPTAVGDDRLASYEDRIEFARAQLRECILAGIPRDDVILDLAPLPEAEYEGTTVNLLRLASHLSQVDRINLSLCPAAAATGMQSAELFGRLLTSRALAAGVTCVLADARSERITVSLADRLVVGPAVA
jgi:5-methyltetrahydrofolate--homocysteine methyltransferase